MQKMLLWKIGYLLMKKDVFYIVRNFLQWSLLLSKANEKEEEKITKIISDLPNFDAIIRPTIKQKSKMNVR